MPALHKLYTRKEINELREKLIAKYGNNCAICGKSSSTFKKRLSVDHNHKTNKIRGLLCFRCNKFLLSRHTIDSAFNIWQYLVKYDLENK